MLTLPHGRGKKTSAGWERGCGWGGHSRVEGDGTGWGRRGWTRTEGWGGDDHYEVGIMDTRGQDRRSAGWKLVEDFERNIDMIMVQSLQSSHQHDPGPTSSVEPSTTS